MSWLSSLSLLEHIFFYLAVPATLVLLIQTVLSLLGLGGDQTDFDAETDIDADIDVPAELDTDAQAEVDDASDGLHLFTVRGLVAFFTLFGWTGLLCSRQGLTPGISLLLAFVAGNLGMFAIAFALRAMTQLQASGTLTPMAAVGSTGTVYLTVPAARSDTGKVVLLLQERMVELEAITDEAVPIPTDTQVEIIGIVDERILVVRRAPTTSQYQ